MRFGAAIFLLIFTNSFAFAQLQSNNTKENRKGKAYVYWGWNRAWFSQSDIHFEGENYDFILADVVAKDRQSPFKFATYFHPSKITIPQYNVKIGYFFHQNYSVTLGTDHMKYVVQGDQSVKVTGQINDQDSPYNGNYDNDNIELTADFLRFEHTDGLNYINADIRRFDELLRWKKISLNITEGIGTGILFPRTNVTLLGKERNDEFHLSGYGFSALLGANLLFYDTFFIQTEWKGGFINMPDIRTTNSVLDKANQQFFFTQWNVVFGANFRFKNRLKKQ